MTIEYLKIILRKPYVFYAIMVFIIYLTLAILLSGFYNTIPLIIAYANTLNWFKLGLSILLSLLIGILVSINFVYILIRYKERKFCKEGKALAGIGTVAGLATGVCPLCVTGLIPLVLGFIGVSFSLASLPFQGIEAQVLVVVILIVSLFNLNKRNIVEKFK